VFSVLSFRSRGSILSWRADGCILNRPVRALAPLASGEGSA
jgi:hypothetical protein